MEKGKQRNRNNTKQKDRKKELFHILCILTGIVVLIPLGSRSIMNSPMTAEWAARVEEIAEGFQRGHLYLYPSAGVFTMSGSSVNGMDSNMWLFIPGGMYWLCGKMGLVYRLYMAGMQVGTLAASILLFQRIFAHRSTELPVFFGMLLYMTCPYRIYLCYDLGDFSQAFVWMLIPCYLWALMGVWEDEGKEKKKAVVLAAVILAGIGYADMVYFLAAAGITAAVGGYRKRLWIFVSAAAGGILFGPGILRLIRYVFLNGLGELHMPLKSIMADGYRFGQFFSSFAFRDNHPGMGLGVLICVLTGMWQFFVEGKRASGTCKAFMGMGIFLSMISLARFPWDYIQRLGAWALKLVSLVETPAVCWGRACIALCVPAAGAIHGIAGHEDRKIALGVPGIVMLTCYGVCVYQCNMLMY